MPILGGGNPPPVLPISQGMKRQRVIELANARTGRIAEKDLNLDAEFLDVLQELCLAHRWYWRRKRAAFDTAVSLATYDLGPADDSVTGVDCEQIIAVELYDSLVDHGPLAPIFDVAEQELIIETLTEDRPRNYFIDPGTTQTLRLYPVPDRIYSIRVAYWAVPNYQLDDQPDQIPLVPGFYHRLLVKALERNIFRAKLGLKSADYLAAASDFDRQLATASLRQDFAQGRVREWTSTETSVQSH